MRYFASLVVAAVLGMSFLTGCGGGGIVADAFAASSTSFNDGATIPIEFTGDGANKSPQIAWENNPDGVKCFAIVMDDIDAPGGTFAHWAVYNIASNVTHLDEDAAMPADVTEGVNDFGNADYDGPNPPAGTTHTYTFTVYALSEKIANGDMDNSMTNAHFKAKFANIILKSASFTGEYE